MTSSQSDREDPDYTNLSDAWDYMRDYIDETVKFVSTKRDEQVDKDTVFMEEEDLPESEYDVALGESIDGWDKINNISQFVYRSLFISSYCLLESSIGFICYKISREKGNLLHEEIRKRDLRGKIELLSGRFNLLNINVTTKNMQTVLEYVGIRDNIVHNYYMVGDNKKFQKSKFSKDSYKIMRDFFEYA